MRFEDIIMLRNVTCCDTFVRQSVRYSRPFPPWILTASTPLSKRYS